MVYRDPPTIPLVAMFDNLLLAVDSRTGQKLWHYSFGTILSGQKRMFRLQRTVLITQGSTIQAFDVDTGTPLGSTSVGFYIDTGAVHGDHLFVVGHGIACLDPNGKVLWRVDDRTHLVGYDGAGSVMWELAHNTRLPCALAIGDELAQTDFE